MNSMVVACIAGGLALIFVSVIAYDSILRSRRHGRFNSRSGQPARASNPIKNLRTMIRSLDEELARRRRQRSRERDLRK